MSITGLISPLRWQGYVVLTVTWLGLSFKLLFGDVITGKFEYHKHGCDLCILTMGTALSMLSLQLISKADILPGIPGTGLWSLFTVFSNDVVKQRIALLVALFIVSCFLAFLTALISRAVGDPATKGKNLLSLMNFGIGSSTFGAYLFLLIAKV